MTARPPMNHQRTEVWTTTSTEGQVTAVGLAFGEEDDDFCDHVGSVDELKELIGDWDAEALRDLCGKFYSALRTQRVPPKLRGTWEWTENPFDHLDQWPGPGATRPWDDVWRGNLLWADIHGKWGYGGFGTSEGEVKVVAGDPVATVMRGVEAAEAWARDTTRAFREGRFVSDCPSTVMGTTELKPAGNRASRRKAAQAGKNRGSR